MYPESSYLRQSNERGFALVIAIFVIVILSVFGLLIARYTTATQTASAEDYLLAQALHSAESVIRLNVLYRDGGGSLSAAPTPLVYNFSTYLDTDTSTDISGMGTIRIIRVRADHPIGISRTVEIKYLLPTS